MWADRLEGVVVQGITGTAGRAHTVTMQQAGTPVVAGVSPGRGGETVAGVPVYDTVAQARRAHRIDASVIFAPSGAVLGAAMEALDAGIALVAIIAEGVPTWDSLRIRVAADARGATVAGPNTGGAIRPGCWKLGISPNVMYRPGPVGILSRTGSAMHEAALALTQAGIGQSTAVDVGGDKVNGNDIIDAYEGFVNDPKTRLLVVIGEIGSDKEERLAGHLRAHPPVKPMASLVLGRHAPAGRRMGHAGAIIKGSAGTAAGKAALLASAGVVACTSLGGLVAWAREHGAVEATP